MRCSKVRRILSSYIDREIEFDKARLVEEHLGRCLECSRELDVLLKMKNLFTQVPTLEPTLGFWEHLVRNLHQQPVRENYFKKLKTLWGRVPRYAWVPAVVTVALIVVIILSSTFLSPRLSMIAENVDLYLQEHNRFGQSQPFANEVVFTLVVDKNTNSF